MLLATSDGGQTWQSVNTEAVGPMLMLTPQLGWLVEDGANAALFVTRDGAKTWQRVLLESPVKTEQMKESEHQYQDWKQKFQAAMSPDEAKYASRWMSHQPPMLFAAYDLPTFTDLEHGYVCVKYPGVAVLFETSDGGVTWRPDRIVTGIQPGRSGTIEPSAIVDSTWILGRALQKGLPVLSKLGPHAQVADNTMPPPEASGISEMSFITARQGWVFTFSGRLLATEDGGTTWTDITPARQVRGAVSSTLR